jgi:hypothetical protein
MPAITGAAGAFYGPKRDEDGLIVDSVLISAEPMTMQADNKVYIVTDSSKRYWDKAKPIIVEVGDGLGDWTVATEGFSVQYAGGIIAFKEADASREVRVSVYYYELEEKLGFFSWTLTTDQAVVEATDFQSDGWVENVPANRSWTAQAEQHWRSEEQLNDWIGELLPVSFYVDDRDGKLFRYEGVGYVSQEALTTPQGDIVNRTLQFTGDGAVWPRR